MKKNIIYLFILLANNMFSQITLKLINAVSNKPASYIMVLNDKNEVITSSDELGIAILNDETKLSDKLIFESIFFERKEVVLKKIHDNSTIMLKPKITALAEVVVSSNAKKYLVLSAYYRIYNVTDSVLISFIDAEVKYIKKKNSFKKKVLNFRIFTTEEYKDATLYWIANLNSKTLFDKVNKKYYLVKKEKSLINIIGKKDNKIRGTIKTDLNLTHNSNTIITVIKDYENYSITDVEEYTNDDLLTTNIKDLKYKSKASIVNITPKMIQLVPSLKGKKMELHKKEFFIQSVDYITKKEYKDIMKQGYSDTSVSHYKREFWKNLENIKPLDSYLQKQLNVTVLERKAIK